jgi:hypothetical protein
MSGFLPLPVVSGSLRPGAGDFSVSGRVVVSQVGSSVKGGLKSFFVRFLQKKFLSRRSEPLTAVGKSKLPACPGDVVLFHIPRTRLAASVLFRCFCFYSCACAPILSVQPNSSLLPVLFLRLADLVRKCFINREVVSVYSLFSCADASAIKTRVIYEK